MYNEDRLKTYNSERKTKNKHTKILRKVLKQKKREKKM